MSSYRGRTGPNFSEYLNNLNTLAAPFDDDQFAGGDSLDLNQDLAMFTNTDFTHFDIPSLPEAGSFNFDLDTGKVEDNVKYEDLLSEPRPARNFNAPTIDTTPNEGQPFYSNYNTPIQPAPTHGFSPVDNLASPTGSTLAHARRKAEPGTQGLSPEEKSRLAAEEDKRRRNTAASARFRVKKKQREQSLEKTVKEVNDKNTKLEAKVQQLEMENKWLKELITEKNGMQSKEEMAAAYHQFRKESEERELKMSEPTTGVGTA